MKKSTAFLPTSLALAMAMALPSNVFAEQIISDKIKLVKTNDVNTFITADYNRIQAESAELDTAKVQHNYTHIFAAQGNSIKDVSSERFTRTNTSDARFNHLTETANDSVGQYTNHSIRGSDNLSFYTIDNKIDEFNSNLLDDSPDFQNPFVAEQATYAKSAMTLTNHNTNTHTNITADAGLQNFAFEVDASSQDVVRKEVFLNKDGITFIKTKLVGYDPASGEPQYEDIANGQGVTITPTGIKNLAAATEEGDAVSFGQTKKVIDEKINASEARITRSLNASIAGMIGVPPSSPPPSAAIKQLNDNLAATDKRLDESNQRLNSAIDINDGVLTIKNDMNANNKKITKVANATDDGDAVNLGQLKAYVAGNSQAGAGINQIKGDVVRLDKNLKQGMAAQSALNGLFQPYGVGKFSATAAVGGYGSETAVAVGTGYRFNENLAGKGGVAFPVGNASQATYNLGVNYEW